MNWLALSDGTRSEVPQLSGLAVPGTGEMEAGTLVAELALTAFPEHPVPIFPLDRWQAAAGGQPMGLLLAPGGRLEMRGPGGGLCLQLPPLSPASAGVRVAYRWDAPAGRAHLVATLLPSGPEMVATGQAAAPLPCADLRRQFGAGAGPARNGAVKWIGLAACGRLPCLGSAVAAATLLPTPGSMLRADQLCQGDLVMTRDEGALPLCHVRTIDLPTRGSFTPVRLRAPYLAHGQDVIVAPAQRIVISGAEVEYLFGEDEVLVESRHLVDGRSAIHEVRRPLMRYVELLLARPAVVHAAHCTLELPGFGCAGAERDAMVPQRGLHDYEAVTLQHMLASSGRPNAA